MKYLAFTVIGGFVLVALLCASVAHPSASAYAVTILITEDEAKLPPPKEPPPISDRAITRGPKIELSAEDNGTLQAPVHLKLNFKTFGGATVDLAALQATYIKDPSIDLTQRVKPFAQQSGIDIPDAQLPVGQHMLKIDIKDSEGRSGSKIFVLKIQP